MLRIGLGHAWIVQKLVRQVAGQAQSVAGYSGQVSTMTRARPRPQGPLLPARSLAANILGRWGTIEAGAARGPSCSAPRTRRWSCSAPACFSMASSTCAGRPPTVEAKSDFAHGVSADRIRSSVLARRSRRWRAEFLRHLPQGTRVPTLPERPVEALERTIRQPSRTRRAYDGPVRCLADGHLPATASALSSKAYSLYDIEPIRDRPEDRHSCAAPPIKISIRET